MNSNDQAVNFNDKAALDLTNGEEHPIAKPKNHRLPHVGSQRTIQEKYVGERSTWYGIKELWLHDLGRYEIRELNWKRETQSIRLVTEGEAHSFKDEIALADKYCSEVNKDNMLIAHLMMCDWGYDLERLPDGTYRIVEYPIYFRDVYDYTIHPADEAKVAWFLKEAGVDSSMHQDMVATKATASQNTNNTKPGGKLL